MPSPDPEALMDAVRRGDGGQLGPLLEAYRNYLWVLARAQIGRHLQSRVDASDVVQDTFLVAKQHFARFRGTTERELLAWLRRILVNRLAREVEKHLLTKKQDARRELSLDQWRRRLEQSSLLVSAALASQADSPSEAAQKREAAAQVADQLARLRPDYREVIVLRNLEGLSFDEVADRMGRSSAAVRQLWVRALRKLKCLNDEEGGS